MKRWCCVLLAAVLACAAAGCNAQAEPGDQYQQGYDAGYRAGFLRGQEEAAGDSGMQYTPLPTVPPYPGEAPMTAAPTPVAPILINPTPDPNATPSPTPVPQPQPVLTGAVSAMLASIRSGPGDNNAILYQAPQGTVVEIYAEDNGWFYVRVGGIWGYVYSELITGLYVSESSKQSQNMPEYVWIQQSGDRYHLVDDCSYTNRNTANRLTLVDAQSRGYIPCPTCFPTYTETYVWVDTADKDYHASNRCTEIDAGTARQVTLTTAKQLAKTPCYTCRPAV